ncbi:MAG: AEC family transporter [Deltaproteobacteria bacterium]|nr:AEC family transporter [Deltaproteobacteria bacterium]
MLAHVLGVFLDVVLPVFAIVGLGYAVGPRLGLDGRTLARAAYYVFVPAFAFHVISTSRVELAAVVRMTGYIVTAHLAFAACGFALARVLRRSREVTAVYVMVAVFGNVGNFGLALIRFRLGDEALAPATIYFIAIMTAAFVVCVAAAGWAKGGGMTALASVLKTPALWAVPPALAVSAGGLTPPLWLARTTALLADAMIPTMLFALGMQLAGARNLKPSADAWISSAFRLLAAPALAAAMAAPFGLGPVEQAAGILQAGMPAAVLVSIIAMEYEVEPTLATTTVFLSTLLSLPTLTFLLSVV